MPFTYVRALPGKAPELVTSPIDPTTPDLLKLLQEEVGGYITIAARRGTFVPGVEMDAFANDDGYALRLSPNRWMDDQPIVGTILVCAANQDGDTVSIDDPELQAVALKWARSWEYCL